MANIAPLILTPQPAPQIPASSASGPGSDLSFKAVLEKTVNSGATTAQPATARPASPQKNIARQAETANTESEASPARSEKKGAEQDVTSPALATEIDGPSLALPSIVASLMEPSPDRTEIPPALLPQGDAGPSLATVSDPEKSGALITTVKIATTPLTDVGVSVEASDGDQQASVGALDGERQASVEVLAGERQATVGVLAGEQQAYVEVLAGERQTSVGVRAGERQTSVEVRAGGQQTSVGVRAGERQTSVGVRAEERQTSVGVPPGGQQTSVGVPPGEQQTSVGVPPGEQQASVGVPPGEQQTSVGVRAGERQTSVGVPPGEQQTSVGVPPGEQQTSVGVPAGGLRTSVEVPTRGLRTSVEVPAGGLQTSVEVPAGGLQTFVGALAGERQTSGGVLAGERQTSVGALAGEQQTSVEGLAGLQQTSSGRSISNTPFAAAESADSTPAAVPVPAASDIKPPPERPSQLPVTGRTVLSAAAGWETPPPAPAGTTAIAAEPDIIPISPDTTKPVITAHTFPSLERTDTAATDLTRNTGIAPGPTPQPQPRMARESAATGARPKSAKTPDAVVNSGSGTGLKLDGDAEIQQNPALTYSNTWLTPGHSSSRESISSGYSVTAGSTTPPVIPGKEPSVSTLVEEPTPPAETGKATITRLPAQAGPLDHLAHLTSSFQVSSLVTDATSQSPISSPQTEMTPLIASFNQLTSLRTPVTETPERPASAQQETLRQEVRGQFSEVQVETRDKGSDGQGQQPNQQNRTTDFKLLATPAAATATSDQATVLFTLNQAVMSPVQPQHAAAPPLPVAPPPGAAVTDDLVFNQIVERFQLHTRNQETQLHIQLHPAELGEMKINLTLKEGSIRAHIVAQSGQVQEILEKNMVRLKSILEGQGFTIEEILVSTKSDDVGNFDLLQDQLSKRNSTGQQSKKQNDSTFNDTYERVVTAAASPATGVNITA